MNAARYDAIWELVRTADEPMTIRSLCAATGISRSSVYHLVQGLIRDGLVRRTAGSWNEMLLEPGHKCYTSPHYLEGRCLRCEQVKARRGSLPPSRAGGTVRRGSFARRVVIREASLI